MVAVGENGVNNKIVFTDAGVDSYSIDKIIEIKLNNETELSFVREDIYEFESSGIQTKDTEFIKIHTSEDVGYFVWSKNFARNSKLSQDNNGNRLTENSELFNIHNANDISYDEWVKNGRGSTQLIGNNKQSTKRAGDTSRSNETNEVATEPSKLVPSKSKVQQVKEQLVNKETASKYTNKLRKIKILMQSKNILSNNTIDLVGLELMKLFLALNGMILIQSLENQVRKLRLTKLLMASILLQ